METDLLISRKGWRRLRTWYRTHGRHQLPWRQSRSPWSVFLAEFLLLRTRAEMVAQVFPVVLEQFSSAEAVIDDAQEWKRLSHSLGLRWRADRFVDACQSLKYRYDGEIPVDRKELLDLPGVGHYISSAVRAFAWNLPEVLVDTNTMRLAGRLSGDTIDGRHHRSRRARTQVSLLTGLRTRNPGADNYALLDLAALVCLPGRPLCSQCPIRECCATGNRANGTGEVQSGSQSMSGGG